MHKTTPRFWKCFEELPESVQDVARKNFEQLRSNPLYPSLHFKKIDNLWSVRTGSEHRALAVEDGDDYLWIWIGAHDEYERMLKNRN